MENIDALNELDLTIIRYMLDNNIISPKRLTTLTELTDNVEVLNLNGEKHRVSKSTIWKSIRKLCDKECILKGAKIGKTNRYYVAPKGAIIYYQSSRLTEDEKNTLVRTYNALQMKDRTESWKALYDEIQGGKQ